MLVAAAVLGLLAGLLPGWAPTRTASAADPTTYLVSRNATGASRNADLSPDSAHVAYESTATDLVPGDTNNAADIFTSTAATTSPTDPYSGAALRVSVPDPSTGATQADGASSDPSISADGRYIAFVSAATNLVTGGASHNDIYIRDTVLGTTVRVQAGATEPNGDSSQPSLSDDGRFLAFTSEATNLGVTDTNGVADVYVLDRDTDGDGRYDTASFSRVSTAYNTADKTAAQAPGESIEPSISGNGGFVAFATANTGFLATSAGDRPSKSSAYSIYRARIGDPSRLVAITADNGSARSPSVDATGDVVAFVGTDFDCQSSTGNDAAMVFVHRVPRHQTVYAADFPIDYNVGASARPALSADGSRVAWDSTQPRQAEAGAPLAGPVVRVADVKFDYAQSDSWFGGEGVHRNDCVPIGGSGSTDVGPGTHPGLSAGGRTIAYDTSEAPAATGADRAVVARDTHSNNGLQVTSVVGVWDQPDFVRSVDPSKIPITELRGYGSVLGGSPIHAIPIHAIPIHAIPIHAIPIHAIPIHAIPIHAIPIHAIAIPGGWAQLLVGTPFDGKPLETVTLGDVLDWAADNVNSSDPATAARAKAIEDLTLGDFDLTGSGLEKMALASIVLGAAPLSDIAIPGTGDNLDRWHGLVTSQGMNLSLDDTTTLLEYDNAGGNIATSRIDTVSLPALPIDQTLFRYLKAKDLFYRGTPLGNVQISDLSGAARSALFGCTDACPPDTLADHASDISSTATVADLAAGVPASVTFGDLLLSLVDPQDYPWEQVDLNAVDAAHVADNITTTPGDCRFGDGCGATQVDYRYVFDPGPGESTTFAVPVATAGLPPGTRMLSFSTKAAALGLPLDPDGTSSFPASGQDVAEKVVFPLPDMAGGSVVEITVKTTATTNPNQNGTAEGTLTSGDLNASGLTRGDFAGGWLHYDNVPWNYVDGNWQDGSAPKALAEGIVYRETITSPKTENVEPSGELRQLAADDSDTYVIPAPPDGKRLVVSTNAMDGQIVMSLFKPAPATAPLGNPSDASLGSAALPDAAGDRLGTPAAESAPDATQALNSYQLVDSVSQRSDGTALVSASSEETANTDLLVRVTNADSRVTDMPYTIRYTYENEAPDQTCPAFRAPATRGATGTLPTSWPSGVNTIYLIDNKRFGDLYGSKSADEVTRKLAGMDGINGVKGVVLPIDANADVQTARAGLDANPCSISRRTTLVNAISTFLTQQITSHKAAGQIRSVVLVGGDDVVPFAPVAQHTSQFGEAGHADDLRRTKQADGSACPASVATGDVDPCATPLSAAASAGYILTDDAYGLATAYNSLGGYLYVPSKAVGRLVETPAEIIKAIEIFCELKGVLPANSSLTGGYGAWAELPDKVTSTLSWRSPTNTELTEPWTKAQVAADLFPGYGPAPKVVSLNAHFDEQTMLPGVAGADTGNFDNSDLYGSSEVAAKDPADALKGTLMFTIGCHAGNALPDSYYEGKRLDWAELFGGIGGYVGNTGYGLANSTSTALSERLLTEYANWIGVSANGRKVSAGEALTYAKQSYLGGYGLYTGYDDKALMQATYYGLPMYTIGGPTKDEPLPEIPPNLTPVTTTNGLSSASLDLNPTFDTTTVTDENGNPVSSYLTANGQDPQIVPDQPILPKVVSQLRSATGQRPHGVFLTSLTSTTEGGPTNPTVSDPNAGDIQTPQKRFDDIAFPSTFAHTTRQISPSGTKDMLVVTPARVQADSTADRTTGVTEKMTSLGLQIFYADNGDDDFTPPTISSASFDASGSSSLFRATADDEGGTVKRVLVLYQRVGQTVWTPVELSFNSDAQAWLSPSQNIDGAFRWFAQAVDASGNVTVYSSRGYLDVAQAPAPALGDPGPGVTLVVGDRLQRSVDITDATSSDTFSASYTVGSVTGTADVVRGDDGKTRVLIDQVFATPLPTTPLNLQVCRQGGGCASQQFDVTVVPANSPPAATVSLSPTKVIPSSTLTATASGTDPDNDPVTLSFAWSINGVPVAGATGTTLDLLGRVQRGDTVTVTVTPNDGKVDGSAGVASVVVSGSPPSLPSDPTLSPNPPESDDVLVASIYPAVDPDGDPVTYTYVWKNGTTVVRTTTATTATTDSLDLKVAGNGDAGDVVSVTVTASDGSLVSVPRTASVTVKPAGVVTITASGKNADGTTYTPGSWTNQNVTVSFTCSSSRPPVKCPGPVPVDTETPAAGQPVTGSATDANGRVGTTSFLVKIDKTKPTLAPTVSPDPVSLGGSAVAVPGAADALSGVVSQSCQTPSTSQVGSQSVSCTATDAAGNKATVAKTYSVIYPSGRCGPLIPLPTKTILLPIYPDGSSVFKRGSVVPVLFRICDANGKPVTSGAVKSYSLVSKVPASSGAKVNEPYFALPATTTFKYEPLLKIWYLNAKTSNQDKNYRYTYKVNLADGTSLTYVYTLR